MRKGSAHTRTSEFERLYRASYGTVYGYVRARMACEADAQDVVAEAFMRAARSFSSYDPSRATFVTWVVSIAKNCMVNHYRRLRPTVAMDDVPETALAQSGDQDGVDDRLLVEKLLACLGDEERELVAMKYREGRSNVQIAAELGMNPSTVATKLARAREKMRRAAERDA